MRVGIVCAGDEELAPFLGLVKDWKITERAMLKFYQGAFNGMGIFFRRTPDWWKSQRLR